VLKRAFRETRTLISTTFDHDEANPDFVRLVSIENIHRVVHAPGGPDRRAHADQRLLLLPRSNRHTFGMIFRRDLSEEETMMRHKGMIADAVINYLKA
jgi:hypothetical protein